MEDWGIGLVCEQTADGPDFTRFCDKHCWASEPAATIETTTNCPHCQTDLENGRGVSRYRALLQKQHPEARA